MNFIVSRRDNCDWLLELYIFKDSDLLLTNRLIYFLHKGLDQFHALSAKQRFADADVSCQSHEKLTKQTSYLHISNV